jgi:hypothetical protein
MRRCDYSRLSKNFCGNAKREPLGSLLKLD